LSGLGIYRTRWLIRNQSTEPILRTDFVVVIALGVKVKRSLHLRTLHGLRVNFRLIHQPIAKAVAKIVKSEAVSVWESYACRDSSQVTPVEHRRADWDRTIF